ncbi:LysE family translocator [Pokkaliibacter sp. MBI-7]|uniref:LysE family translocator n=1 Tax=Pokkaliibacter sp. MBI-7 TaxID=3040600 RepID=UPI00244B1320|nr:LysE family translocator [Pokkaliibacter sp. MBI-7]MDH2434101.1 LysE family translocator [Pokkaliibacter sp. MBI-7]
MDYALFLTICLLTTFTPGPAILLVIRNATRYGIGKALIGVLGNLSAMISMATLSAIGMGAVILSSLYLFTAMKLAGGAYLIWLGIKTWRSKNLFSQHSSDATAMPPRPARSLYAEAFMIGFSNPKAIAFYTALFPQFIDPHSAITPQLLVLGATFACCSFTALSSYALLAHSLKGHLAKAHVSRYFSRITGGIFMGFGLSLIYSK